MKCNCILHRDSIETVFVIAIKIWMYDTVCNKYMHIQLHYTFV